MGWEGAQSRWVVALYVIVRPWMMYNTWRTAATGLTVPRVSHWYQADVLVC